MDLLVGKSITTNVVHCSNEGDGGGPCTMYLVCQSCNAYVPIDFCIIVNIRCIFNW